MTAGGVIVAFLAVLAVVLGLGGALAIICFDRRDRYPLARDEWWRQ